MENQTSSKSIILNYGLILGILSILISLTTYALGNHLEPHWSISVVSFILMTALIVLGIKKYKEANSGFISWGQSVKIGVGITILAALISVIYNFVFVTFIEPEYASQLIELQQQKMLDRGMSEEQIEATVEMTKKFSSPYFSAAMAIIGSAIFGFIISAIAGAVMKKTEEDQY